MTYSQELFAQAQNVIPGGVNSPVRAFKGVGAEPIFFKAGQGAYLTDVDGKAYIDYIGSWGPLILGHCHEAVIHAVMQVLQSGTSFGAPTVLEIELAQKVIELMPSIEKIRMVNSGTEATMTAIRLARGFTKRSKIIKFNGCYHGHCDSLLVKAGSGVLTCGIPSSAGVPDSIAQQTLVADFNNLEQTTQLFEQYGDDIAAVIVEPVAGNMNMVLPTPDFLPGLRKLCDSYQSVLIFDEVMTGFRVALGGAQAIYNVIPDLTTLGKIIGGGLPVGALGGKARIMDHLAPVGSVYQAGTLSGNPLAMAAGLATLQQIEKPDFYEQLMKLSKALIDGLQTITHSLNCSFSGTYLGGMFGFCFTNKAPIIDYSDVAAANEALFKQFFHGMLQQGIYFAPSMFEAGFLSGAHTMNDIETTLKAAQMVLKTLS